MFRFRTFANVVVIAAMSLGNVSAEETADKTLAKDVAKQLTAILNTQVKAWNNADIPAFMGYYWKSDALTFSSGGTTRRGWQATMDSYKKRYPTPAKMGHLAFDQLEFQTLGDDAALVLGNWHLTRKQDEDIGGNFSLVFRKFDGHWRIIHDHSSAITSE